MTDKSQSRFTPFKVQRIALSNGSLQAFDVSTLDKLRRRYRSRDRERAANDHPHHDRHRNFSTRPGAIVISAAFVRCSTKRTWS
jgi:hypothetical protein